MSSTTTAIRSLYDRSEIGPAKSTNLEDARGGLEREKERVDRRTSVGAPPFLNPRPSLALARRRILSTRVARFADKGEIKAPGLPRYT